ALGGHVTGLAERQPLLMLIEDAHWIDATTQEALDLIVSLIASSRVLMVVTFRPEYQAPWTDYDHVLPLALTRLGRGEAAEMVERVTGGKPLPDEVLNQIVAKTDGVPLFVEELTKTVLEAGFLVDTGERYELDGPLPPLAIPTTLHDSLMARLDRLTSAKEVAQIGACIGREFSFELLAAVSPLQDDELSGALEQLVDSALIFRRGNPPDATYSFKHALVQDAAYESLLKSRRQRIHQLIAEALSAVSPEVAAQEPELLAHHYTAAGLAEQAIPYWLSAGKTATARMALVEASSHLQHGLEVVATLGASPQRDTHEIDLRVQLGTVTMMLKGWGAVEVQAALVPAQNLSVKLKRADVLFPVLWGLWLHLGNRGRHRDALKRVEELLDVADVLAEPGLVVLANSAAACTHFWTGNFELASRHRDRVIEIYDFDRDRHLVEIYNHDAKVLAMTWAGANMLWVLGYPDQAVQASDDIVELARRLEHPFNLAFALTGGAAPLIYRQEPDELLRRTDEALTIGRDQSLGIVSELLVPAYSAPALASCGRFGEAINAVMASGKVAASMGSEISEPEFKCLVAQWTSAMGNVTQGLRIVDSALAQIDRLGERYVEAEAHRVKGVLLLASAQAHVMAAAEACFRRAIGVARSQKAKSLELRAATSLSRLWQSQHKNRDAYDLLAPVFGWFTEGFDTADLKEARVLLEELAQAEGVEEGVENRSTS
ncbi:MAG: hypothetical protein O7A04_01565, partial [Acidobacteria bacterium]|nr:hypothetical protein [Acidobacteriota bacterium]